MRRDYGRQDDKVLSMRWLTRHITRCFLAGVIALLPIGGTILGIVYMEVTLSESWLARQPWYFPGLGLIAAAVLIYAIGLVVSTVIGRWIWNVVDRLIDSLPILGNLYQTLKQVLGYGEGQDALFEYAGLIPARDHNGYELGLVTGRVDDQEGRSRLSVFVPGSPNPMTGRLIFIEDATVHRLPISVSDALKALVAVGKSPLEIDQFRTGDETEAAH